MEMKHSLHLQQKQSLIMTPRLQQALKLLQVPTLELQQMLKHELIQNPLLEDVDEVTEQEDIESENSADEKNNEESEEPGEEDSIDWSEYMQDGLDRTYVPQSETSIEFLEKVPVTRTTLAESLLEQVRDSNLPSADHHIAELIIGNIDDYGYLKASVEEISAISNLSGDKILEALKVIQTFDPAGVGARDSSRDPDRAVRLAHAARHDVARQRGDPLAAHLRRHDKALGAIEPQKNLLRQRVRERGHAIRVSERLEWLDDDGRPEGKRLRGTVVLDGRDFAALEEDDGDRGGNRRDNGSRAKPPPPAPIPRSGVGGGRDDGSRTQQYRRGLGVACLGDLIRSDDGVAAARQVETHRVVASLLGVVLDQAAP